VLIIIIFYFVAFNAVPAQSLYRLLATSNPHAGPKAQSYSKSIPLYAAFKGLYKNRFQQTQAVSTQMKTEKDQLYKEQSGNEEDTQDWGGSLQSSEMGRTAMLQGPDSWHTIHRDIRNKPTT